MGKPAVSSRVIARPMVRKRSWATFEGRHSIRVFKPGYLGRIGCELEKGHSLVRVEARVGALLLGRVVVTSLTTAYGSSTPF